ncbi:actin-binding Rho-activating protein-like [Tropilaelaps mercedesae]|uniref:Actin-binding Rho-activating protein-like n=1 Tax=Tropilaelaps mercedesae TaxID=418985 RepID=A0A1V9WYR4_9ACAR|nr:actin-binding Rho-activating protein-like [Tropilaelaps mercedesae]
MSIRLNCKLYTVISDKLVGSLLRARKKGLVDFEGEILYQRRDDDVPITLVKSMEEVNRYFGYEGPRVFHLRRDEN